MHVTHEGISEIKLEQVRYLHLQKNNVSVMLMMC